MASNALKRRGNGQISVDIVRTVHIGIAGTIGAPIDIAFGEARTVVRIAIERSITGDMFNDQLRIDFIRQVADHLPPSGVARMISPVDLPVIHTGVFAPFQAFPPIVLIPGPILLARHLARADPDARALPASIFDVLNQGLQTLLGRIAIIRKFIRADKEAAKIAAVSSLGEIPAVIQQENQILFGILISCVYPAIFTKQLLMV